MKTYRVTAVCRATLTETWTIRCPHRLSDDAIRLLLAYGGSKTASSRIDLDCTNEVSSDEEDREVTHIESDE